MKIALAQLNFYVGDFEGNVEKCLVAVAEAKAKGADIICLPELALCGYPPRDFLEFNDFIRRSDSSIERLCAVADGIAIAVGAPTVNPVPEGKDLFNSAYFIADGKVQYIQHKALLPTYDIFDEYRYFEPATHFEVVEYKGKKIALTICEDIWNIGNTNPMYTICPMDELMPQQPDFVLNLSASPYSMTHATDRKYQVKTNVDAYKVPFFYVNHVGAQTEILFDGGSLVYSPDGRLYDEMPYFEESIQVYDLEAVMEGREQEELKVDKVASAHDAIVMGIKDFFDKLGFKKAVFGLSGGVDSALAIVLAVEALGAENVHALLMPSQFSSDHSVNDAVELSNNLGISYDIINIEKTYHAFMDTLSPYFKDLPFNIAEENLQARARGVLLMAFSNKFGHIVLNTSNKSEIAVGYGTLYGDMCGGLSVIGDLYKTEVFEMCRYINRNGEVIPTNIITKPPSAELRPDQKDSDSLPDYDVLDAILYEYIEGRKGPKEIIALGYEEQLVTRILKMVNRNEFKRHQTAPILRVSDKSFGMGRRLPIVGKYLL